MEFTPARPRDRFELACIIAVVIAMPSLVTWIYFGLLHGQPAIAQQAAYAIGKSLQFALPVLWLVVRDRTQIQALRPKPSGLGLGIGFGILVAGLIFCVYVLDISGTSIELQLQRAVTEKTTSLGIDSAWAYTTVAGFYAICHSFLEELYWRWFVYGQTRRVVKNAWAGLISSLGFMTHHVLLLGYFFGFDQPRTYLFSILIAAGGLFWVWLYQRSNNLVACWVSHAIVDAAIFVLGHRFILS